jgi:hypothetical protein
MGLKSKFFQGDPKLEACLINDAAHITPGASGNHVSKIQQAILSLQDGEDIDDGECTNSVYGPSTAAAVLAYKKKRKIINLSYETQADNIVGKMTIAALDDEILEMEQPPTGQVCSLSPEQMEGRNITRRIA